VSGMTPRVNGENMIVLMVLQALLGTLSSNVKALTLEFGSEGVTAHFLLREESSEDREQIEENLPTEVSAFTIGVPGVGDTLVIPMIELVADRAPDYVPPGRRVLLFRD
jgi:hypothetical protein